MAHILLIEPDAILGKTYVSSLSGQGHSVTLSRHAQIAVLQAEERRPDIVLLELQLPGHSGVEFLYEFRSYPEWQNIPVILHTLVPMQSLEKQNIQFKQLMVVEYLYKPTTNLRQLASTIDDVLQTNRVEPSASYL